MKNLLNIEKSGFRRGEYVAYTAVGVWRVYKRSNSKGRGSWVACPPPTDDRLARVSAFTLTELSEQLMNFDE